MNYLLSFQFCLNFGNLCIYRDVSSTVKVAVAAVCFCLIEIKCLANILSQGAGADSGYFLTVANEKTGGFPRKKLS